MKWIKIEEGKPDHGHNVLAVVKTKPGEVYDCAYRGWDMDEIYACRYSFGEFCVKPHGPVLQPTHWMYEPELPE